MDNEPWQDEGLASEFPLNSMLDPKVTMGMRSDLCDEEDRAYPQHLEGSWIGSVTGHPSFGVGKPKRSRKLSTISMFGPQERQEKDIHGEVEHAHPTRDVHRPTVNPRGLTLAGSGAPGFSMGMDMDSQTLNALEGPQSMSFPGSDTPGLSMDRGIYSMVNPLQGGHSTLRPGSESPPDPVALSEVEDMLIDWDFNRQP